MLGLNLLVVSFGLGAGGAGQKLLLGERNHEYRPNPLGKKRAELQKDIEMPQYLHRCSRCRNQKNLYPKTTKEEEPPICLWKEGLIPPTTKTQIFVDKEKFLRSELGRLELQKKQQSQFSHKEFGRQKARGRWEQQAEAATEGCVRGRGHSLQSFLETGRIRTLVLFGGVTRAYVWSSQEGCRITSLCFRLYIHGYTYIQNQVYGDIYIYI